jgi:predicted NBD/HSP70 family sugar kinase
VRSAEIRRTNERLILRLLYERDALSQTELADETGLQPSTVFRIFADLTKRGLIREVDQPTEDSRRGRRPSYFSLNPDARYAIGIDIAQRRAAIMLVDFTGRAIHETTVEFPGKTDGNEAISRVVDEVRTLITASRIDTQRIIGIGVGAPGMVDIHAGSVVYYARFPGMEGISITALFEAEFDVPVFVHNNASVVALSEARYGRVRGASNLVAFLIRAGVGAAYVNNGAVFTSQGRTAFEAGHMFVDVPAGAAGAAHALEDYISEDAILSHIASIRPDCATLEAIVEAIDRHDPDVCAAIAECAEILVHVLRNIALLLNPEAFLIITRFPRLSEYFAAVVDRRLHDLPGSERFSIGSVVGIGYDPIIACRGATHLVFDAYFSR